MTKPFKPTYEERDATGGKASAFLPTMTRSKPSSFLPLRAFQKTLRVFANPDSTNPLVYIAKPSLKTTLKPSHPSRLCLGKQSQPLDGLKTGRKEERIKAKESSYKGGQENAGRICYDIRKCKTEDKQHGSQVCRAESLRRFHL
ncbi:hypothetical protein NC653_032844 [Populus alba x Populus x berolinensis]|uniref:Uncharacterized protein n=1 Tax=Populus alba x Populus x berolinensis TaxID=444605 RepID=A0AAD6LSN0_9ROSI|nr:hypothetical protein NC653_032844 [Populus alba x Populus x berolinensis]